MGQGYSLTTLSAGSAGIDVPELADLTYEKSLGNARFMKTIRARHKDGLVVAKVVMKPYSSMDLKGYVDAILEERKVLTDVPNALPYHRILETSANGYLVRQYIHSSLYDRMSTRPFLEDIEKKWLAFQLLCAVRDCHARNIYHGDIKTENVLVTSWNWLYLSDFSSSFKPTYLPEDNPADFSFYFDTSGRRTCYLAPERFLSAGTVPEGEGNVNWAMDVFSVGCVIAELFLETPIFSLSQIFKYRQGEYSPDHVHLDKIHDKEIREMVSHMIQLEPESRYSAEEYLNFWRRRAFPDYFYSFLHQYIYVMTDPSSGRKPVTAGGENLGESDDRIDQLYNDFDKISYFLAEDKEPHKSKQKGNRTPRRDTFPLHIDIPNYRHRAALAEERSLDEGAVIFLNIVVSSIRNTARATARIRACELLLAFAEKTTDEAILDRIVPYVMALLNDKADLVKIAALRTLTQLLAMVAVVTPINAYVFPEYILPRLQPLATGSSTHPNPLVRATYASCIATLATTASKFLDLTQALRADGTLPTSDPETEEDSISYSYYQHQYDVAREDLTSQLEVQTKALLTDPDASVRRAMLGSVGSLCVFFGSARASDVILSHLNTYLNDRDWMLKCAFFEAIVGVAIYVGGPSLEEFILPLMVQALTDLEEFVVERALRSFSSMAQLGLFQRTKTWELVDVVGRFTMHPNIWIREAAAHFISSAIRFLSIADNHSIIVPLIKPYLKVLPSELSELRILDSLKKPLPRLVLEMAMTWATKSERGIFWLPAQQQRTFTFGGGDESIPTVSAKDLGPKALARTPKNEEDEQWITRLRNAGMTADDEFKLIALREYIWQVAHRRRKEGPESKSSRFNSILTLSSLGITPQTVFFTPKQELLEEALNEEMSPVEKQPRTIADALLDATVDDGKVMRRTSLPAQQREDIRTRERSATNGETQSSSSDVEPRRSLQVPQKGDIASPVASSPAGSLQSLRTGHALRPMGSAINLLSKTDSRNGNKAIAEIGTSPENAFGKVDGSNSNPKEPKEQINTPLSLAQRLNRASPEAGKYKDGYSYDGNDPTVLKLLDSLYLENYPADRVEFGPFVPALSGRQPIRRGSGAGGPWRPEGTLVAMLGEHTAGVTRVVVAPDHAFFLTGSDDGTVKVWDAGRLERNISHRARQTYKLAEGAKVTSLTFIENSHCFTVTGDDGSLAVVRVDCQAGQNGTRYGKLRVLRSSRTISPDVSSAGLPGEGAEFAVWSEHYKSDSQSILMLATNKSRIVGIELRTMSCIYDLRNPLHHGTPTCFAMDRRHHWLILGTSHGVLDLWDLRFRLRLKAWGFAAATPIHRLILQPIRGSRKSRLHVAGGTGQGEVTTWDVEKSVCVQVLRTGYCRDSSLAKSTTLIDIDEERAGGMLGRFATSTALSPSPSPSPTPTTFSSSSSSAASSQDNTIRAMHLITQISSSSTTSDGGDGSSNTTHPSSSPYPSADGPATSESRHYHLLTAGPDRQVRFWDPARPEHCAVVSGLGTGPDDSRPPTYAFVQPAGAGTSEARVLCESLPAGAEGGASAGAAAGPVAGGKRPGLSGTRANGSSRPSRSAVLLMQQRNLLRTHLDTVLDVALLEWPYGMCVSADRAGMVYVFS